MPGDNERGTVRRDGEVGRDESEYENGRRKDKNKCHEIFDYNLTFNVSCHLCLQFCISVLISKKKNPCLRILQIS